MDHKDSVRQGLSATVHALVEADKRVLLVNSVAEFPFDVPWAMALHRAREREVPPMDLKALRQRNRWVDPVLHELGQEPSVRVVDLRGGLCPSGRCLPGDGDRAFYSDSHHLTVAAAAFLSSQAGIVRFFRGL